MKKNTFVSGAIVTGMILASKTAKTNSAKAMPTAGMNMPQKTKQLAIQHRWH